MSLQVYIPFVENVKDNVVHLNLEPCAYLNHCVPRELCRSYLTTKVLGPIDGTEGVLVIGRYSEHGLERCYNLVGIVSDEGKVEKVYEEWKAQFLHTDPELETQFVRVVSGVGGEYE